MPSPAGPTRCDGCSLTHPHARTSCSPRLVEGALDLPSRGICAEIAWHHGQAPVSLLGAVPVEQHVPSQARPQSRGGSGARSARSGPVTASRGCRARAVGNAALALAGVSLLGLSSPRFARLSSKCCRRVTDAISWFGPAPTTRTAMTAASLDKSLAAARVAGARPTRPAA